MDKFDVAIVGGGPAGSTVGALLKTYNPQLSVLIAERERFPRDHVGESQLPLISQILEEMGVWDKVEAAGFPIKIGATYRWGKSDELWDFEFLSNRQFVPEPRPAQFVGQRRQTAFQVDRAIYDEILLNHAGELGCEVRQETRVLEAKVEGDRILELILEEGGKRETVVANHYVDCSGHAGILRRSLGVGVEYPTNLQNIAIWDYWDNTEWAVQIGTEGTRVQVLSLGYGWIWFIPLGATRTSIGLIVPADYFKAQGQKPEELYLKALASDPIIQELTKNARRQEKLSTTKDWSFLSARLSGENWFLAGESAGFADPILATGMTLAHRGAKDVAYTILELEHNQHDPTWLRERYNEAHRRLIRQHIRFADFWYTQNGLFSDLKDFAQQLAGDQGLEMTADEAWRWLGTGGFISDGSCGTDLGGYAFYAAKEIASHFLEERIDYQIFGKTHFQFIPYGTENDTTTFAHEGRIIAAPALRKDGKLLPLVGLTDWLVRYLSVERTARELVFAASECRSAVGFPADKAKQFPRFLVELLESMLLDGWIHVRQEKGFEGWPRLEIDCSGFMHPNDDIAKRVASV
jgi:flavin-dependent dehydrogenase